ncbi:hypothetical protein E8E15_003077 [Penicillium rubens]|jgi:hypothetical protein|uniref:uncharacterized protein n=1 Tax=Penicillium rubens TaxID=1108849 RepID=UPI001E0B1A1F|nr:uncharacterized protein N7525_002943 [Penicillium rubens]KAF3013848.1 hypothetical protein E8E15_003077 [Penicillium rubens]KAJ5837755.1 hypothetical protein N7525_002943 [Penicillium rubens]
MNTVEQGYTHLSREILQSAEFFLPVISLVGFSLLSLILIHRYIKHRRLRAHTIPSSDFKQKEQDFWLQSTMEKGELIPSASGALSACDILQPLSHTSLLPSSGVLAAQVREQQGASSNTSLPDAEVQKCNESIQQMCDEDTEGVRAWKRVVVEYR